jgi:hypothetical protein
MKIDLLKKCKKIMERPHVIGWYEENLSGESQKYTLDRLNNAYLDSYLTLEEVLAIAFIVGLQWNVKFKVVP